MISCAKNYKQTALVGLCGYAGLRVGEALACETNWIDPNSMMITIVGKGDKTRVVPMSSRTWESISSAYVMAVSQNHAHIVPYKDRFARKIITNLGVRAGLRRHISSHELRATFATHVWDTTLDLRVVQELLGHASSNTTEIYTGVDFNKMRNAVEF